MIDEKQIMEITCALRICNNSRGHRCSECPVFSRYDYRVCKKTVDKIAVDIIESLQSQLATSQAQLKRAIEDIKKPSVCDCCKRTCQGYNDCLDNGYMYFEWRQ